jgi:hypothetical protein
MDEEDISCPDGKLIPSPSITPPPPQTKGFPRQPAEFSALYSTSQDTVTANKIIYLNEKNAFFV